MCMEGCIRFHDVEASNLIVKEEQCSCCGSQWFRCERDTLVPVQTFKVVHLLQQLRFKLGNSQECAKIAYGRSHIMGSRFGVLSDVFDSGAVRRLCEGSIVGQNDILVTMFVDQFNFFDDTKMLATIIHVVNLNIDPKESYRSFLEPIIKDFCILATSGIQIQTVTRQINVKIHLVMATGDNPAMSDLMNLAHHNSFFGCQACFSKGVSKHHTMCFFGNELPVCMGTVESLHQFEGNSYSVNGPNVFRDLPTLTSPTFFGLDEMHLLGHGIGKQLYKAFGGKLNQIDRSITKSRADISAIFTGSWQLLEETTGRQKAVHWLDFLLSVVLTVVVKNFVLAKTRNVVQDLVKTCAIAQQWKVAEREINIMEEAIGRWHVFLHHEVAEKRKSLAIVADECGMNYHNLVSSLVSIWGQDSRHVRANNLVVLKHLNEYRFVHKFFSQSVLEETKLFVIVNCLRGIWPNNEAKFFVCKSLTLGRFENLSNSIWCDKDNVVPNI
ncbi:hypothetical protein PHYBLDRAFT_67249 [Phycomyces blakesleeanus NRRL 1555(-)]|uniref:Uncharacterized protein n=1 Tax=Phycomyces blakesleeanus (strain ATCC 8743b / DSM 1359 / FGSC 10004 / NBRC 33097 / NRRL 1555) TaxID=763407 RepID=A0A162N9J7_PHYB8|nr:hypothetical protein PHYBLDRAFT_67249 [Phycomyces blakesleeanus NRRL 1555(-)]OAD67114.1 hypothetical protein PHYBLDRAFT_67249 [Phycomyces blakesleeanus NRRL 1555(-)]|eukprot:XP_018285154.1 hypothetical protein PHYBLDRAFT_67249 [Phycomyces blakesleeanus NRRL 1555(-)]